MEMIVEMTESGWVPTELAYIQVFKTIRGTEVRKQGLAARSDPILLSSTRHLVHVVLKPVLSG